MAGVRDTGGGGDKDLSREAESLTTFKGRIDKILDRLEKSPASHKQVGDQTVTPDAYGKGFSAAGDLAGLYEKVHTRLELLSKLFGDQLEALGIATQISEKGYNGVEARELQRFRSIQASTEKHYEADGKGDEPGTGPQREQSTDKDDKSVL